MARLVGKETGFLLNFYISEIIQAYWKPSVAVAPGVSFSFFPVLGGWWLLFILFYFILYCFIGCNPSRVVFKRDCYINVLNK